MRRILPCLITLFAAAEGYAQANDGFYTGAAISRWQYSQVTSDADVRMEALELNAGFWFHPLLSAEVRAGTSLGDRELDAGLFPQEVGIDYFGSVYWRPEVANERAKLYGLLGYSRVRLSAESYSRGAVDSTEETNSGVSFGAGMGFSYSPNVMLNIEWKQLIDADGFEIDGFTAGFDYRF